jgi:hypothetical protein
VRNNERNGEHGKPDACPALTPWLTNGRFGGLGSVTSSRACKKMIDQRFQATDLVSFVNDWIAFASFGSMSKMAVNLVNSSR